MKINAKTRIPPGNSVEVFLVFLKLGLTSFGGPLAHIGYFRKEFVEQRAWLSDHQFGQLLAICQFLPGPASSQLGFCIGFLRASWLGAMFAFFAFTLPSVALLLVFSASLPLLSSDLSMAAIHGLKLAACAVVADAVLSMAKNLCPDIKRKVMGFLALVFFLSFSSLGMQLVGITIAALTGSILLRNSHTSTSVQSMPIHYRKGVGIVFMLIFCVLLFILPLLAGPSPDYISVASTFYQTGALVFGGGHVALPLLQETLVVPGWVSSNDFLAGYGAAQAIPGPMFSFSAYLGSVISTDKNTFFIVAIALVFMFLPGFLLIIGILPFCKESSNQPIASSAIAGVNTAVVGLLAAALYNPIATSAITSITDVLITTVGFGLLTILRFSPLITVGWCIVSSVLAASLL